MLGLLRAAHWCFHTVPVPAVTHGGGCVASPLHFQSRGACAGPAGTVGPGVVRVPVPCWLISPVSPRCLPRLSQTSPQKTHPTPQHLCAVSQVCSSVPVPTGQSDVAEQQCVRTRTRLHAHAAGCTHMPEHTHVPRASSLLAAGRLPWRFPEPSPVSAGGWGRAGRGAHSRVPPTGVSMGSADQQFSLAEILSQTYGVQEECEEAVRRPEQREEGLVKDFVSQVPCMGPRVLWLLASAATSPASCRC